MYYHSCPYCNANLDPGEKCDCAAEDSEEKEKQPQWRTEAAFRVKITGLNHDPFCNDNYTAKNGICQDYTGRSS